MARNRIIYASQSVWANGHVLYRVQSLGSTTTFTSEDIFELGHLDIIDIVDDVPAVAVTLNTNDFGDVKTMAILAQVPDAKLVMTATGTNTNANLVVVSGTNLTETAYYLHGASLADFAVACGNLPGVTMWAPVQEECSLGTLDESIDQTLFMDEVFVNSLEFAYTTGANATENYGAETDQKMWLLNQGKFVSYDVFTLDGTDVANDYVDLTLASGIAVTALSNGSGFLRKDANGLPSVSVYVAATGVTTNWPVNLTGATATEFYCDIAAEPNRLTFPTGNGFVATDIVTAVYCSTEYAASATSTYFTALSDTNRPDHIGAIRQGQIEVYIVADTDASFDVAWRLTGCTISTDLTREALSELGHLGPFDRPVTLPIPITVTVDSTAGDLEMWAKLSKQLTTFDANTLDDIDLADLMSAEDLKLVVKIYAQTDEEAGGTADNRIVATTSELVGQYWQLDGTVGGPYTGSGSETEHALKTIVVEHIKITDEGSTLDVGSNATQTFGFRSTNDLYVVKGDLSIGRLTNAHKIRRNA
jgi:hypothetical protein